jgi:hypothetical protein
MPSTRSPRFAAARRRAIHQDSAHQRGRYGEEMAPVLPIQPRNVGQMQVGLMHQVRHLQGFARPFVFQAMSRQTPQFPVDARNQSLQRLLVAIGPGAKELGGLRYGRVRLYPFVKVYGLEIFIAGVPASTSDCA